MVITRQGTSILLIFYYCIFLYKTLHTYIHKYVDTYKLFTRCFVGVLRITTTTFVHQHCTAFPDYPSRCIAQSWCNGHLYLVFRFHDCSWKRTINYLVNLYCCCFLCHFGVTELYDLDSTRDSMQAIDKLSLNYHQSISEYANHDMNLTPRLRW